MENAIILFIFALVNVFNEGSTQRRRYEVGIHPNIFCPKSKVCPDVDYKNNSSFYKRLKVCQNSHECSGYEICCEETCNQLNYCMKTAQWIDDHDGKCPTWSPPCNQWPFTLRPRCRQDADCYLDAKCCLDPCLLSNVCYQVSKVNEKINWDAFLGNVSATIHVSGNKDVSTQKPVIEQEVNSNEVHHEYQEEAQRSRLDRDEIVFTSERKHLLAPPVETIHLDVYVNDKSSDRRELMVEHAMINLGGISRGIMGYNTNKRLGRKQAKNIHKRERSSSTSKRVVEKHLIKKPNCLENFAISCNFMDKYCITLIVSLLHASYSFYYLELDISV